jgi:hypothetical protein
VDLWRRYLFEPSSVGFKTAIGIAFTNQSPETIYAVNCLGMLVPVLEKRVDGGWMPFWAPVVLDCLSAPIVFAPGSTHRATLQIWGALPGRNYGPEFRSDDIEGTYRIVLDYLVTRYAANRYPFGDSVPLKLRYSNSFFLDDPRR